jgi:Flp pilus assembly protein TadB
MNDLDFLNRQSHGSLMRSARTSTALFGSGVVVGIVLALVFHAIIYAGIIIAAVVIVLVAAARMALGRKR